jgi:WD40 repeat protein
LYTLVSALSLGHVTQRETRNYDYCHIAQVLLSVYLSIYSFSYWLLLQVRYSSNGSMYVTVSKDGGVRIWDGVSAQCTRAIIGAHTSAEATSASFTNDQR